MKKTNSEEWVIIMIGILVFALIVSAWFTHIITCFADAAWGFLIAGAIFFPVGICHGVYIWFT